MNRDSNSFGYEVIPAPLQCHVDAGREFIFSENMTVMYGDTRIAPIVERFCLELTRRTGVRFSPMISSASNEPIIDIQLVAHHQLEELPKAAGVRPSGDGPADERHSLTINDERITVYAKEPAGIARALTTLIQLLAIPSGGGKLKISVPCGRILDAPRYAWRGLSLDLSRAFFTSDEIQRVIDLLALYKLNVLHLHLTDDQSWRLAVGRPSTESEHHEFFYSNQALRALVRYAEDRFITVVPEIDMPGHALALIQLNPSLKTHRNNIEFEFPAGHKHRTAWLDPELPITFRVIEEVLTGAAQLFSGAYIHIGGDEPRGMPHDLYSACVNQVRRVVRSIGKRPLGWQESARAGLGPGDVIQYWFTGGPVADTFPSEDRARAQAQVDADLVLSRLDIEAVEAAMVPVIVSPQSHCYLDVPYAERSIKSNQAERQRQLGMRLYTPKTVAESFQWEPSQALGPNCTAQVSGVEAAIWTETLANFDDLSFLLLPRLPGIAQKAWSVPTGEDWPHYRNRLAGHGRLWEQDGLAYFHSSTVDWA